MKMKRLSIPLLCNLLLGLGLFVISVLAPFFGVEEVSASSQTTSPSFVRIIHASPFVGTADIFVDGSRLLSSFGFGTVTDYAPIPPGPHKVQIALVGKGIGASALTETLSVNPGFAYTAAAIGTTDNNLSLQVFVDNNFLSSGMAKFRVYQLSPDAGSVSVSAGGETLLSGIQYQDASDYVTIQSRGYTFNVTSPSNNVTLSTSAMLNPDIVASLFIIGLFNGTPKSALVTSQTKGLPGLPNTGSDPNAVSAVDHPQPLNPWPLPLGIASLLCIGGGIYVLKVVMKKSGQRS
jgi:Domain of unknown function (DUF4397)